MTPILYTAEETAFNHNGIGILRDAIDCTVLQALNGAYELELVYPLKGIHFQQIRERCVLLCEPDPFSDAQPFRIYRISKPMSGKVTVYARHIAYDMMGIPVSPFSAAGVGAALTAMKNNAAIDCPFTFTTDKTTEATMSTRIPMAMWSLLGGTAGSLLDTYGGEYEFDHWSVKLLSERGADRGVSIRYGKNLTDINQDRNIAGCYTGVYPFWFGEGEETAAGYVELPEKIVYAPGDFGYERILTRDFTSEWQEAPTEEQLRARCEKYIKDNDIGIPDVSWKVEFVQLEQTEEYKDKAILERVSLGDTVTVEFAELGIDATARAVETRYKPLLKRYESVSLGKVRSNLADIVVKQQKQIDDTVNKSVLQMAVTQLTAAILGAKGGAVRMLDTDGDGMADTLYIADDPDPNKAKKVWRFNYEGWGASVNGYNGPFTLGASLDTGFVADFITAGTLDAALVKIKNLIAEKLASYKGYDSLKIDGAALRFFYTANDLPTFEVFNVQGFPIVYMQGYNEETLETEGYTELKPSGLRMGGTSIDPILDLATVNGGARLALPSGQHYLAWKDNGDGTFALIGQ